MKQLNLHPYFLLNSRITVTLKTQIYYSIFYVQTWLLLITEESKVLSKPKTEICIVLYITTGIIGGLIPYASFEKFFHQLEMVDFITTLIPRVLYYNIVWVLSIHAICKFDCIKTCIQDGYFIFIVMKLSNSLRFLLLIFYNVTQWYFLYFHFWFVLIISSPNCT